MPTWFVLFLKRVPIINAWEGEFVTEEKLEGIARRLAARSGEKQAKSTISLAEEGMHGPNTVSSEMQPRIVWYNYWVVYLNYIPYFFEEIGI